ncbi:serine hydrolase domain-containing protein [Ascidiimonas sp. W6]|uniref:serine hydrolase domain-containing protein n=1 Tax=Ascidiimonas meishanensis TaxID=3128903 RepID=UPI0030EC1A96
MIFFGFFSFLNSLFAQENPEIPQIAFVGSNKKVDRVVKRIIRKKKTPGLAITVSKNGNTIFQKGYGYANIEKKIPVNAKTSVFRVASVSKPLAATVLAKMVEQEKIDLDTSLYTYLPEFPKKKYDFTIRQLGGHLAGIRTYKDNEFLNNNPLSISEGVALFANDKLLFEPGTKYFYNSYDWVLISAAVQNITKTPFEKYTKENVLVPLQMNHTYPDSTSINIPELVSFYSRARGKKFRKAKTVNNFFKLAGGGFLSTSEDISKLGNAYLVTNFLKPEVISEFLTSQKIGDKLTYYGIGWEVSYDHKKRPYMGHTGNGVGGYAFFRIYPAQQMVFTILTNMTNPAIEKEFRIIVDEIMSAVLPVE